MFFLRGHRFDMILTSDNYDLHRSNFGNKDCYRYEEMMMEKYPYIKEKIHHWMTFVHDKKVLP